ncbi:MAG: efflux RND transporter periplasmic adaptor subunit, partial [Spirochaetaceae bacterium]
SNMMKLRILISTAVSILFLGGALFFAAQNLGFLPTFGDAEEGAEAERPDGSPSSSAGAGDMSGGRGSGAGQSPAATADQPVTVSPAEADRRDLSASVRLNGSVEPAEETYAYPDVTGVVAEVAVQVGDRVEAGDRVAAVDPSKPGSRYERSPVEAPIDGWVTSIEVGLGDRVTESTQVLRLTTLDRLEVVTQVPERFAAAVRSEMGATVNVFALEDAEFTAHVSETEPVLDAGSRSKEVRLLLDGLDGREAERAGFESGMLVRVSLPLRERRDVVTVPFSALVQEAGGSYVFVIEDERARRREVEVGLVADDRAEITAGLEAGETVIHEGVQKVRPDGAVRIADVEAGRGENGDTQ